MLDVVNVTLLTTVIGAFVAVSLYVLGPFLRFKLTFLELTAIFVSFTAAF